MINNLLIEPRPVSFSFTVADVIGFDEKKNRLILADKVTQTFKDSIDDNNDQTEDVRIENSFEVLRQVSVDNMSGIPLNDSESLLSSLRNDLETNSTTTYRLSGQVVTVSTKKMLVENASVTTA